MTLTLPKLEYPTFEVYLKSLDRKVKFRPFLVKEEKLLLIAKESKDPNDVRNTIIQIINNCLVDKINVSELPMFDIEMVFLNLRARSVGESVKLVFNCQNEVDGQPCNSNTDYELNLSKVKYEIPEGHNSKIMLKDGIGIKLKYPTLEETDMISDEDLNGDPFAIFLNMVMENVDCIFDKDAVWKPEDLSEKELETFFNSLTVEHIEHIKDFFRTSPKVILEDKVACKKCGFEHQIHSEGLLSFFL